MLADVVMSGTGRPRWQAVPAAVRVWSVCLVSRSSARSRLPRPVPGAGIPPLSAFPPRASSTKSSTSRSTDTALNRIPSPLPDGRLPACLACLSLRFSLSLLPQYCRRHGVVQADVAQPQRVPPSSSNVPPLASEDGLCPALQLLAFRPTLAAANLPIVDERLQESQLIVPRQSAGISKSRIPI